MERYRLNTLTPLPQMSLLPKKKFQNPKQRARAQADLQTYLAVGGALAALLGAALVGAIIGCIIQNL